MRWPGRLSYHALRLLPAEAAHEVGKRAMQLGLMGRRATGGDAPAVTLFGVPLASPVGLAAGFDKNGELLRTVGRYGFGFAEVGSVTLRGGRGNPKPRLFRHGPDGLVNRMGLNGDPAEVVAGRLRKFPIEDFRFSIGSELPDAVPQSQIANRKSQIPPLPFGVNIAKTHDPAIVGDAAVEDVLGSYRLLRGLGFYTVLNVSCPNTAEGKTFEEPAALAELLAAVNGERRGVGGVRPLCVKLSPTDDYAAFGRVVAACEAAGVDGYVATNTRPFAGHVGRGGLSGAALRRGSLRAVSFLKRETGKPVIGCGGVIAPGDARALLDAGADAVQAYTGFVRGPYAGPGFAWAVRPAASGGRRG